MGPARPLASTARSISVASMSLVACVYQNWDRFQFSDTPAADSSSATPPAAASARAAITSCSADAASGDSNARRSGVRATGPESSSEESLIMLVGQSAACQSIPTQLFAAAVRGPLTVCGTAHAFLRAPVQCISSLRGAASSWLRLVHRVQGLVWET